MKVADPPKPAAGLVAIDDAKLDATPAVADLDGDHKPEIMVRSQHSESAGAGIQPLGANYVYAYHADGSAVAGWPVRLPSISTYYGSAQEFITEAANSPAVADVDDDGKDEVATGPSFAATFLVGGDGKVRNTCGPLNNPALGLLNGDEDVIRALLNGRLRAGATVMFTAPGDDWYAGRVTSYRVTADGTTTTVPATADAGARQSVPVPAGAQNIAIQAVDDAGNLSPLASP